MKSIFIEIIIKFIYKVRIKLLNLRLYYLAYSIYMLFLPYLYLRVYKDLKIYCKRFGYNCKVLDVGARKSSYTIGLPAEITLLDLPRSNEFQKKHNLGINNAIIYELKKRRNVKKVILEDFTKTKIPSNSFEIISAIEVIEHVNNDKLFIEQAFRLLKKGGIFYITTPNKAVIKNTNPAHIRHYNKYELDELLSRCFQEVYINIGEIKSKFRYYGLKSFNKKNLFQILFSMLSNFINILENMFFKVEKDQSCRLFATAIKKI